MGSTTGVRELKAAPAEGLQHRFLLWQPQSRVAESLFHGCRPALVASSSRATASQKQSEGQREVQSPVSAAVTPVGPMCLISGCHNDPHWKH